MGQDLRELLKQDKQIPSEYLKDGHNQRFMLMLEKELPSKKNKIFDTGWLKIAASVVVILSVSLITFNQFDIAKNITQNNRVDIHNATIKNATVILPKETSQLAEISPEYKKAEDYFLTSIKSELSKINVNDTNRELVESFMKRLENLNSEYKNLNTELMDVGPNPQSIEAMMENLTLRLSLLNRLQSKLKELEEIKNENYVDIQV